MRKTLFDSNICILNEREKKLTCEYEKIGGTKKREVHKLSERPTKSSADFDYYIKSEIGLWTEYKYNHNKEHKIYYVIDNEPIDEQREDRDKDILEKDVLLYQRKFQKFLTDKKDILIRTAFLDDIVYDGDSFMISGLNEKGYKMKLTKENVNLLLNKILEKFEKNKEFHLYKVGDVSSKDAEEEWIYSNSGKLISKLEMLQKKYDDKIANTKDNFDNKVIEIPSVGPIFKVEDFTVPSWTQREIEIYVDEHCCNRVEWSYMPQRDIKHGWYFRAINTDDREIIQNWEADKILKEITTDEKFGIYTGDKKKHEFNFNDLRDGVERRGHLVLVFNNNYSWIRENIVSNIEYKITPKTHDIELTAGASRSVDINIDPDEDQKVIWAFNSDEKYSSGNIFKYEFTPNGRNNSILTKEWKNNTFTKRDTPYRGYFNVRDIDTYGPGILSLVFSNNNKFESTKCYLQYRIQKRNSPDEFDIDRTGKQMLGGSIDNNYNKYLKYKNKYLKLKNNLK